MSQFALLSSLRTFRASSLARLFRYSGNDVIEEIQSNINATTGAKTKKESREYTYGARWTDDVVAVSYSTYTRVKKADILATTGDYYYEKNHLGSVIRITSNTGWIVDEYSYTVYGKAYRKNPNWLYKPVAGANDSPIWNTRLHTGREYDKEISLYYLRARYYDANLGRFVSRDPIGMRDNVNLYTYVANSPIIFVDRFGREKTLIIGFAWYQIPNGDFRTWEIPESEWTTMESLWLWVALETLRSSSRNKYDTKLYFSSAGESELDMALKYVKERKWKYNKLVIIWHSMWADDSVEFSQMLDKEEINVDLLATIDLQSVVDSTNVPDNVKKAVNYRQYHFFSWLPNWDELTWDENKVTNYLVNSRNGKELDHWTIDDAYALQILKTTSY